MLLSAVQIRLKELHLSAFLWSGFVLSCPPPSPSFLNRKLWWIAFDRRPSSTFPPLIDWLHHQNVATSLLIQQNSQGCCLFVSFICLNVSVFLFLEPSSWNLDKGHIFPPEPQKADVAQPQNWFLILQNNSTDHILFGTVFRSLCSYWLLLFRHSDTHLQTDCGGTDDRLPSGLLWEGCLIISLMHREVWGFKVTRRSDQQKPIECVLESVSKCVNEGKEDANCKCVTTDFTAAQQLTQCTLTRPVCHWRVCLLSLSVPRLSPSLFSLTAVTLLSW